MFARAMFARAMIARAMIARAADAGWLVVVVGASIRHAQTTLYYGSQAFLVGIIRPERHQFSLTTA